ncbi:hypothetical protein OG900_01440 [Streptomyces sp. NBC_00433]
MLGTVGRHAEAEAEAVSLARPVQVAAPGPFRTPGHRRRRAAVAGRAVLGPFVRVEYPIGCPW